MKELSTDAIKQKVKVIFIIGVADLCISSFLIGLLSYDFTGWLFFVLGMFGGMCFGFAAVFQYFVSQLDKIDITPEDLMGMFKPEEEKE